MAHRMIEVFFFLNSERSRTIIINSALVHGQVLYTIFNVRMIVIICTKRSEIFNRVEVV